MTESTTTQTAFRLPATMIRRLDTIARRMRANTAIHWTRTDVVRMLLDDGVKRELAKFAKKGTRT